MTTTEIILLIEDYKEKTIKLKSLHSGIQDIKWEITHIEPEQIRELESHFGVEYFTCGPGIRIHIHAPTEGYCIGIQSVPCKIIRETTFLK